MAGVPEPHPLARRIHDRVLQLLGSALLKTELCEQLQQLDRGDEIPAHLSELRETLQLSVDELRAIMADLRNPETLKNYAA